MQRSDKSSNDIKLVQRIVPGLSATTLARFGCWFARCIRVIQMHKTHRS